MTTTNRPEASKTMMATASDTARPRRGTASERVMTAATKLLIEGRGHFEIDQLAEAAGCSTGAIYHNYGSKAGVLATVIARYNETVGGLIAPNVMPETRHLWLTALRHAVQATVAFMWSDPLTPVIVQETIKDASAAAETERWLRLHVAALAAHFAEAQTAGHLPPNLDPEVLAAGIAGGLRQIMRVFVARTDRPSIETAHRETWGFIARQVGGDGADDQAVSGAAKHP